MCVCMCVRQRVWARPTPAIQIYAWKARAEAQKDVKEVPVHTYRDLTLPRGSMGDEAPNSSADIDDQTPKRERNGKRKQLPALLVCGQLPGALCESEANEDHESPRRKLRVGQPSLVGGWKRDGRKKAASAQRQKETTKGNLRHAWS